MIERWGGQHEGLHADRFAGRFRHFEILEPAFTGVSNSVNPFHGFRRTLPIVFNFEGVLAILLAPDWELANDVKPPG